jgi:hypothetical protein
MSLVVPETTAKESRIKLSLWGYTVHPPLDGGFGNDLAVFAKAPPGVRILNPSVHSNKNSAPGIRVRRTI